MYPSDEATEYTTEDPYNSDGSSGNSEYTSDYSDDSSDVDTSEEDLLRLVPGARLSTQEIPMEALAYPTELSDWGTEHGLCSGQMGACNTVIVAWDWRTGYTTAGDPYGYFRYMRGAHGAGGMGNVDFRKLYAGVPVGQAHTYVLKARDSVGSYADHQAFLEGAHAVGMDPRNVLLAQGLSSCYTVLRDGTVHSGRIDGTEYRGDQGLTHNLTRGYLLP
ncbi:hypothetical protein ABZ069_37990 [Streptomyces microflavus]|uniref:hypothetical protein n=1 Tax=Streptomyces microflavus TaxID=1919 RepID=UPI0033B886AC